MEQTSPAPQGLTISEAATLVAVREFEVREAIAEGTLPHQTRIIVRDTDVRAWRDNRDAS